MTSITSHMGIRTSITSHMGIRTSATSSARHLRMQKKPEGHMTTHVLPWYQTALDAKTTCLLPSAFQKRKKIDKILSGTAFM